MILYRRLLILILILVSTICNAQFTIKGIVVDAKNGNPLPFVNIIINAKANLGGNSDIHGNFKLVSPEKIESLQFSFVGYQKLQITPQSTENLRVELTTSVAQLSEVEILPGINPAHRIIEQVIANRNKNNPAKYDQYSCEIYNKYGIPFTFPDSTGKLVTTLAFLNESVTERNFVAPGKTEDKVIATKMGGFKNPQFASLATDLQPFSFYQSQIPLFNESFLNPISVGSTKEYLFEIKDTNYQYIDSTFIISYQPKRGKNFSGLKGVLAINSRSWAIQYVIAEPADSGLMNFKVQQLYQYLDSLWFPQQLNYEATFNMEMDADIPTTFNMKGESEIRKVSLSKEIRDRKFAFASNYLDQGAGTKPESYWKSVRPIQLDSLEINSYQFLDSIGEILKFDAIAEASASAAIDGIWNLGSVAIDLKKLFKGNRLEGWRPGIGIYTGNNFSRRLRFGGFVGIGTRDGIEKYAASASVLLSKKRAVRLGYQYQKDQFEIGKAFGMNFYPSAQDLRYIIVGEMQAFTGHNVSISGRPQKFTQLGISFSDFQYDSIFKSTPDDPFTTAKDFTLSTIGAELSFNYNAQISELYGKLVSDKSKYPILYLKYDQNLDLNNQQQADFKRLEVKILDDFKIRKLGTFSYSLSAGAIEGVLDPSLIFGAFGSRIANFRVQTKNHFQTMQPYEFAATEYISLFFKQDLGTLLFKSKSFKPKFVLENNIGFGRLSNHDEYQNLKSFNKGYYETGLSVNDLLRTKFVNMYYLGLGLSGYYRYGPYTQENAKDNFTFNLTMSISFR